MAEIKSTKRQINQKQRITNVVLIVLMVAALTASLLVYFNRRTINQRKAAYVTMENLESIYAGNAVNVVSNRFTYLDSIASYVGTTSAFTNYCNTPNDATIQQQMASVLTNFIDTKLFSNFWLSDSAGKGIADNGSILDLSYRNYLPTVLSGEQVILDGQPSETAGNSLTVLLVPVRNAAGTVMGVLGTQYSTAEWESLIFRDFTTEYLQGAYITDGEGSIKFKYEKLLSYELDYGTTFYDLLNSANLTSSYVLENREVITDENGLITTFYAFRTKGTGEKAYVIVREMGFRDDCLILSSTASRVLPFIEVGQQNLLPLIFGTGAVVLLCLILMVYNVRIKNRRLAMASGRYNDLLDNIDGAVIIYDATAGAGRIKAVYYSAGFLALSGYTTEEMNQEFKGNIRKLIYKNDLRIYDAHLKNIKDSDVACDARYRIVNKDGNIVWIADRAKRLHNDVGRIAIQAMLVDVSSTVAQEKKLAESKSRYALAATFSDSVVFEVDVNTSLVTNMENFEKVFGFKFEDRYKTFKAAMEDGFLHAEDLYTYQKLKTNLSSGEQRFYYELRLRRADGQYIWCSAQFAALLDQHNEIHRLVGRVTDINARMKNVEELKQKANTDALTGLYNMKVTQTMIREALKNSNGNVMHALLLIDVDNFKQINDECGHAAGDEILKSGAIKMKRLIRSDDLAGRIGGDEFVIFLKNIPNASLAEAKAKAINRAFAELSMNFRYQGIKFSCSVGVAIFPNNSTDYEKLMAMADTACYSAKANGRNGYAMYDEKKMEKLKMLAKTNTVDDSAGVWSRYELNIDIFNTFYDSKRYVDAMEGVFDSVCQKLKIQRCFSVIFKKDADKSAADAIYYEDGQAKKKKIDVQHLSALKGAISNEGGEIIYCSDVRTLPEDEAAYCKGRHIGSFIIIEMKDDKKKNIGLLGFESSTIHIWDDKEQSLLVFLATLLKPYYLGNKGRNTEEYHQILVEAIPGNKYVIDNKTHRVLYAHTPLPTVMSELVKGASCHKAINDKEEPCPDCPYITLTDGESKRNFNLAQKRLGITYSEVVISLNWDEHPAYLFILFDEHKIKDDSKERQAK